MQMKILFLVRGPDSLASTRHRVLFPSRSLEQLGHRCTILDSRKYTLYGTSFLAPTPASYLKAILLSNRYDLLYIQKIADPITRLIQKIWKSRGGKTIFDFDDALFLYKKNGPLRWNPIVMNLDGIIRHSDHVIVGSHFLKDYAITINPNTSIVPTPVNTDLFQPDGTAKKNRSDKITIGWLGDPLIHRENLKILPDPLKTLGKKHKIRFKMVSALGKQQIRDIFHPIEKILEIDYGGNRWLDISRIPAQIKDFDIGVMPLADNGTSRGKCALKALQYMSMGIPVVASNIGESRFIIQDGVNGYIAATPEDWVEKIDALIRDQRRRKEMGKAGYQTVRAKYSLNVFVKHVGAILEGLESLRSPQRGNHG